MRATGPFDSNALAAFRDKLYLRRYRRFDPQLHLVGGHLGTTLCITDNSEGEVCVHSQGLLIDLIKLGAAAKYALLNCDEAILRIQHLQFVVGESLSIGWRVLR
jgi:hypothetical protein